MSSVNIGAVITYGVRDREGTENKWLDAGGSEYSGWINIFQKKTGCKMNAAGEYVYDHDLN